MRYIQEAVDFSSGNNFVPVRAKFSLPTQKNDVSVFLLSNSYEYDLELIKSMPPPRIDYKYIIIPNKVSDNFGTRSFKFDLSNQEYQKKLEYLTNQKDIIPKLTNINYPYHEIPGNVYIPFSEICKMIELDIQQLPETYIQDHVFDIFQKIMSHFKFSKLNVFYIDTTRYKLYQHYHTGTYTNGIINMILAKCLLEPDKVPKLNYVFIFRTPEADYKLDLSRFTPSDCERIKEVMRQIGSPNEDIDESDIGESIDDFDHEEESSDEDSGEEEIDVSQATAELNRLQKSNRSVTTSIKTTLRELRARLKSSMQNQVQDAQKQEQKKLYNAKAFNINAELLRRIDPKTAMIGNYKTLSEDLLGSGDNPVENQLIDDATKKLSENLKSKNEQDAMNTISSPREFAIRANLGRLRLKDLDTSTVKSIADVPIPPPLNPIHINTTNPGSAKGTAYTNISKVYEDTTLDQDIVNVFTNLSKLPDGFDVMNIEVTDISTVATLMHNWKVTLKSKTNGRQSVLNVHIPKVINGRFLSNGTWYNIGKQDFPIPILKVDKRKVMLTSNYNKISVERYDTRSLVDIGMMRKVLSKATNPDGSNKYIHVGTSTFANSHYVSTIEYDEYAKQWYSFENKEANCIIMFNRNDCAKAYSFVSVKPNEFCCGMVNQVPIVINTDTGISRSGETITDIILNTLPENLRTEYIKMKPGKMSMYATIRAGVTVPLGIAIASWEGLSTILEKCGAEYKYVDKSFDDTHYLKIPFKDKTLAIQNTIPNQLIFNGFFRINTKAYNASDFETTIMNQNSVYVDIFNQMFFKQFSQLTTFIACYNFFVDPITAEVCDHYNLPNDIVGMLIYSAKLLADNNFTNESNSALFRVRSTEIIPGILHYQLARAISRYNNGLGSKSSKSGIDFNPNELMNELLSAEVPNRRAYSALNPAVELNEKEKVSKKGYKGLNIDKAYSEEKRSYNDTMIGKMAMSSPNNNTVGIVRQLVADPKLESVRGYTSTAGPDTDFNDLQLASFSELLTPGTVSHDDAIRTAIATSQNSHIVQTADAAPVLIANGVDELIPAYMTSEFSVVAEEDGSIIDEADGYIIAQYKSGKKRAINIGNRYSFAGGSGFCVDNKLLSNFNKGDKFKKGDILAYHEKYFTKNADGVVRFNLGPIAKIAFAGIYSTYEDAGIMTAKMSKRLETSITMKQTVKLKATDDIDRIVQVGDEVEISDPLIVFGLGDTGDKAVDNFLKAFQNSKEDDSMLDTAKRIEKSKYAGKVVDVRIYTTKSMDKLSPSLFELTNAYFKENKRKRKILDKYEKSNSVYKMETLFDLPTEPMKGTTIKGITTDVLVEIYIEHSDDASVGDKCVAYGAAKQIISEVIPEGLEPYSQDDPDEEISMFTAPGSTLRRMIPSLVITATGNKVLINLKRQVEKIWREG